MRSFILPFALLSLHTSQAQSILCDTLPIFYDPVSITFTTGEIGFGDSVIVVEMTNTSTTDMAYPQLKLVPLTPLPPGMSQNTLWDTFASSWNSGVTMSADCFFDVEQPIPVNYTVTFELWARNLTPLLVDDSCVFDAPFTINLNPSFTGIAPPDDREELRAWPNPADDHLNIGLPFRSERSLLVLTNVSGAVIREMEVRPGMFMLCMSDLEAGVYSLTLTGEERRIHQRIIVAH